MLKELFGKFPTKNVEQFIFWAGSGSKNNQFEKLGQFETVLGGSTQFLASTAIFSQNGSPFQSVKGQLFSSRELLELLRLRFGHDPNV